MIRTRFLLALLLVVTAGCASAPARAPAVKPEAVSGFEPFRLPGAVLMCRVKALPPSTPPSWLAFEFEDGTLMIDDRLIGVAYESLGNPRVLVMTATERTVGGEPNMHAYSISFPDSAPPTALHGVISGPGQAPSRSKPEHLSAPAIANARDLMVWLWNHRCKGAGQ